jgi:hypothetical protein
MAELDRRAMLGLAAAAAAGSLAACSEATSAPAASPATKRRFANKVIVITGATSGIGTPFRLHRQQTRAGGPGSVCCSRLRRKRNSHQRVDSGNDGYRPRAARSRHGKRTRCDLGNCRPAMGKVPCRGPAKNGDPPGDRGVRPGLGFPGSPLHDGRTDGGRRWQNRPRRLKYREGQHNRPRPS